MWGFHDRQLILRKLLALNMAGGSATDAFRRRWRWQQTASNKQVCFASFTSLKLSKFTECSTAD